MCVCVCVCVCMYICAHTYMYTYQKLKNTDHAFFMALQAILAEGFDCYSEPCVGLSRGSGMLIYPALEYTTKSTLTQNAIRSKVPGGNFEIRKGKPS